MNKLTDEELLDSYLLTKDNACFEELANRHREAMVDCIHRRFMEHDRDGAEDIVQQAFIKLIETEKQFDRSLTLKPYLYSIAINHAINVKKYNFRRYAVVFSQMGNGESMEDVASDQSPTSRVEHDEIAAIVAKLRDQLPEGDRQAIILVYVEGLSFQEAATTLGIPLGSLKTRINRGIVTLRSQVSRFAA